MKLVSSQHIIAWEWSPSTLTCGLEPIVGTLVERSAAGYLQLAVVKAGVTQHERSLSIHKADG